MKEKLDKKGFTLVELLATIVLLGLLTAIAAPNIIGILQSTKLDTYIEDGKKLGTLAEYKIRGNSNIIKPGNNQCIGMTMEYLGMSEFKNPPYDGQYQGSESYVIIKNVGGTYYYYVQLIEKDPDGKYGGITLRALTDLSAEDSRKYVTTGNATATALTATTTSINVPAGGSSCTLVETYIN